MTDLHKLKIEKHHKASRTERRIWPWLLLILLLAAAGIGAYQYKQRSAIRLVEVVRVRIPEPATQSASGGGSNTTQSDSDLVILNATGYIMAAHKIELASKVVGRVAWVGVEMGDKVKKEQVLVRLEDDEYKARVAQQKGQLDNARARLAELEAGNRPQEIASAQAQLDRATIEAENAERNYKRLSEIRGRTTSQNELDEAEANARGRRAQVDYQRQQLELMKAGMRKEQIDAQRATVAQLDASLAMMQIDLDNTVIRSPLDATILERNVEQGEFVTTGFVGDRGAKGYVVSIADLNDLLVDLDISQNDFAKVSEDGACWITTDAYPDKKYQGVVDLISPEANRQKATVQVRVKVLDPDELLKPDMNGRDRKSVV